MAVITLGKALSILERAKNCLVCFPISKPEEVYENTMAILNEYQPSQISDVYAQEMKYVIKREQGIEVPIVFSSLITHSSICNRGSIVSAGFCVIDGYDRTQCYGESTSLGLKSRPEDTSILKRNLFTFY